MRTIRLTQNQVALVDDADYKRLSKHTWCAQRTTSGRFYAVRWTGQREHGLTGKRRKVHMHQEITGRYAHAGEPTADHINNNGLDNRRENLRIVPWGHNASRGRATASSTGYRGVRLQPECTRRKYSVKCAQRGIGTYTDPVEAALAYDIAAIDRFGQCAVTNFLKP